MPFDGNTYADPRLNGLRIARARIAKNWCQDCEIKIERRWYAPWSFKTSYCAIGAIEDKEDLRMVLLHQLGIPFGDYDDIADWNDAPDRTKEEVLELFDEAIAGLV